MTDSNERWHRVWAVVDDALDREPALRAAYVEQVCAGELALRRDVERALALADEEHFLDAGALSFAGALLRRDPEPLVDAAIPTLVQTEWGATYALEREIGRGGSATVYLARDLKHDRHIAVKVLHAPHRAFYGAERFVREIRLTAQLQHPHILGLLDSGVFGPETGPLAARPFYTMPYVQGESLRARLARGPVPVPEAVAILRDVALALAYAHECGVIHRDIKPENVLLSSGSAVVADFGIAKALQLSVAGRPGAPAEHFSATSFPPSTAVGTLAYMAPEQATRNPDIDSRADVYSWGVVAYELLAGRHPFAQLTNPSDLFVAQISEDPQPLAMTAVPVALGALVMRCLAKVPADRPSSGGEILAELDAAKTSIDGAKATRSGAGNRRRVRWIVAASTLLIFTTLAARAHFENGGSREPIVQSTASTEARTQAPVRVQRAERARSNGTPNGKHKLAEQIQAAPRVDEPDPQSLSAPNMAYTLWAESFDLGLFADAERWCVDAHHRYPSDYRFVRCELFDVLSPSANMTPSAAWALIDTLNRLAPHAENDIELRAGRMLVAVALARAGLRDSADAVIAASRSGAGELLGYEAIVRVQLGERDKALALLGDYLKRYPEEGLRLARRKTWMWRDLEEDPRFRSLISAK